MKTLFVGVDPGITTGIAILDLHGDLVKIFSKRDMSRNEIIKTIINSGHPLIITSDVNPMPRNVRNIARKLDARIYLQEKSLSVAEKKKVVKEYSDNVKSGHESDALAAVIKAWKNYRPFLNKIEKELKKYGLYKHFDLVVEKFIKGEYGSMVEVIEALKK